jgi:hypothetical protein
MKLEFGAAVEQHLPSNATRSLAFCLSSSARYALTKVMTLPARAFRDDKPPVQSD